MTRETIIRAWKNEQYRHTLSTTEQAELPQHPAGVIELEEASLGNVAGGEDRKTWDFECLVSVLVGTCSPGGSLGCCKAIDIPA